ncbi:MAG: sigma-54-dependent Fis family transcriptional regulator [Desulfuromonadales bacterium]|nr:sigma-54-dependent Fis family transcriptional regulator [Desulfuromonadales bacterium]
MLLRLENSYQSGMAIRRGAQTLKNSTDTIPAISLLYVEDEEHAQELVVQILRLKFPGISILLAQNGQDGFDLYTKKRPEIVVTDIRMPIVDGIQMAKKIRELNQDAHIIVLSAADETNYILEAIDIGINNYVLKPINLEKFTSAIEQCLNKISLTEQLKQKEEYIRKIAENSLQGAYEEIKRLKKRLQAENIYLHQDAAREYNFGEIIGQSSAISYVFFRIEQVAPLDTTVLLLGETGTGKGVVARAIHSRSTRKDRPMITVNCTALPGNLIESELFGRERGAFTGADARQMGRFELADGGTIFLDEIGEMPLELQCKLLRVIQDGEFERLGSPRTIKTNVRIIAASNRNLEEEIKNGSFREDLFYRLNVFPITVPPLRQRQDDIQLLVNHFVTKFNKKIGKKITTVSQETLNALQEYHWPGNVRELESVIERAVITSEGSALQVLDRFDTVHTARETAGQDVKSLAELERDHILQVLQKSGWRVEGINGAALLLGLNPSTLRARMRKLDIHRQ